MHQRVGAQLVDEVETVFALPQIEHNPLACRGNLFQRRVELKARVVNEASQTCRR